MPLIESFLSGDPPTIELEIDLHVWPSQQGGPILWEDATGRWLSIGDPLLISSYKGPEVRNQLASPVKATDRRRSIGGSPVDFTYNLPVAKNQLVSPV